MNSRKRGRGVVCHGFFRNNFAERVEEERAGLDGFKHPARLGDEGSSATAQLRERVFCFQTREPDGVRVVHHWKHDGKWISVHFFDARVA
jgi:hypothetical protein